MNKLNRDVVKSIKQIRADMVAKYQKLFKDLKKKGVIVIFDDFAWDSPNFEAFKAFGADAKRYIKSFRDNTVTKLGNYEINELIGYPDCYVYVSADELKKFETVTYPKLYAEWREEQKRAAKDPAKIRAKIEKLQKQLNELEA